MIWTIILGCGEKTTDTGSTEYMPSYVSYAGDGVSVESVNPERYLGQWYEVASTPIPAQTSCTGSTATYGLIDETTISVTNKCYLETLDGQEYTIEGSATFQDASYARLLVDFGFGFAAPYNVVELDGSTGEEPYQYAAVSSIGSLWVLSRTPVLEEEILTELLERLEANGHPVDRLNFTLQATSE